MSRIGRKKIAVPENVVVAVSENVVSVKGGKGELSLVLPPMIEAVVAGGVVSVMRKNDDQSSRSLHGLYRMLLANMIEGVSNGYSKELVIEGVGFKVSLDKSRAVFSLGFSAPVDLEIPPGIDMKVSEGVNIVVSGADKQQVGDFAARIKSLYPAEPYKGKGIHFKGEHVRRKVGKTVA